MTLDLPWPPTSNTAYATVNGRRVKSRAARDYANLAATTVAEYQRSHEQPPETFTKTDRLLVRITAFPPDRRRRDLANIEKIATDAICAALHVDDSQIDALCIHRAEPTQPGRITYTITTIHRTPF